MRRVLHECIVLLHYITLLHVLASIGVVARKLCPICGNGFKLLFFVLLRKIVVLSACFRSFIFVLVSIILEALQVRVRHRCPVFELSHPWKTKRESAMAKALTAGAGRNRERTEWQSNPRFILR
jgi:hypothetical protein